jgi:diguanylate cyclase (GGDEF)-like protein
MPDGGGVATHEDVTEQRRIEARIAHMAHHDALTDLPNRVLLRQNLEHALERAGSQESVAVLWLDLDRFKEVNDTLGHTIGDALLKVAAERLRSCIRARDTVARLGGDEFAVVQTATDQPLGATALALRIIEEIGAPYQIDAHQVVVGTSVGISLYPSDALEADHLLKNADLALYRAKHEGRGTYRFFEPEMDARMHARRQLELDLRQSIAAGEFELHYQPILDLDRNEITTFEALLRWNHPTRGRISPAEFIPLAEETGLIGSIGEWVLRTACAQAAGWPPPIKVAVNLSSLQFNQNDLVQLIFSALTASGLSASRLELEITESVLLENTEKTVATLHRLRDLGVRIAMDDFGTGYSSLKNLRSFPFDKIKVDQSFIQGLGADQQCFTIVQAIATLGAGLNMTTTAEGVETVDQLDWVRALGIVEVQGFYLSKPVPACEVQNLLARTLLNPSVAA